jgi:hypothetical protein
LQEAVQVNLNDVPAFPNVIITMQADGSAHMNVAGTHLDYPAGPTQETRDAIVFDVLQVATHLKRPVRMTTTEPDGTEWLVAVCDDGSLVDLTPIQPRKRRSQTTVQPAATPVPRLAISSETPVLPSLDRPAPFIPPLLVPPALQPLPAALEATAGSRLVIEEAADELTHVVVRPSARPSALLKSSAGESFVITGRALIGRRPTPPAAEHFDHIITLADETKTMSKTHLVIEWRGAELWITDRGATNGTTVQRSGRKNELAAERPYRLLSGDVVYVGGQRVTVLLEAPSETIAHEVLFTQ